jgi:hypothetical protein
MNRENKGYRQTTFWKISKKEGVKREPIAETTPLGENKVPRKRIESENEGGDRKESWSI